MKPKSFMLIAGEASGDVLAAELVRALRLELAAVESIPTTDCQPLHASLEPRFYGAGGPQMAAAGVDLAFDMTAHSVIGLSDALKNYLKFRRLFYQLFELALKRQPDAIVCVDFSGFNRRFAHAIRQYNRGRNDWFHDWNPRLIQYVSPQVWASREGRAYQMARDYDAVLSIFPFEKDWYAKRVPQLRVEFVGHPIAERYGERRAERTSWDSDALCAPECQVEPVTTAFSPSEGERGNHRQPSGEPKSMEGGAGHGRKGGPMLLLLPGSRTSELARHLPVMLEALGLIRARLMNVRVRMVLPNEGLVRQAKALGWPASLEVQVGGLPESLAESDVAIASTGTVTTECAFFGVPTVALYKTSWSTYQIARRIVKVKYLAMPNLLANEEVFPEFIQGAATAENIARAGLDLLRDKERRAKVKVRLAEIVASLGGPGATQRAARVIVETLKAQGLSE